MQREIVLVIVGLGFLAYVVNPLVIGIVYGDRYSTLEYVMTVLYPFKYAMDITFCSTSLFYYAIVVSVAIQLATVVCYFYTSVPVWPLFTFFYTFIPLMFIAKECMNINDSGGSRLSRVTSIQSNADASVSSAGSVSPVSPSACQCRINPILKITGLEIVQHVEPPNGDYQCSICTEQLPLLSSDTSICKIGSCRHHFHTECLLTWAYRKQPITCPNCRQDVAYQWMS